MSQLIYEVRINICTDYGKHKIMHSDKTTISKNNVGGYLFIYYGQNFRYNWRQRMATHSLAELDGILTVGGTSNVDHLQHTTGFINNA